MQSIPDFQRFHHWLDEQKGFRNDLFFITILLTGELGEVAQVVKKIRWWASLLEREMPAPEALAAATEEYRAALGGELADCLAYLLKLANAAGIDLQEAYLAKMERNLEREWYEPEGG